MHESTSNYHDVVIIGAGLSGIGAACHLRAELPDTDFIILEGRERMGGTWDLFRYPGIRSDRFSLPATSVPTTSSPRSSNASAI